MLGSLFAIGLLAGVAGAALGFYGYTVFTAPGPLAQSKIYMIDKGLGTPEIAAKLLDQGIIANARVFTAGAYLTGGRSRLKAGEYEFPAHATMQEVMALLASGKAIIYKLSIPEGWTSEMAAERINANDVLTGESVAAPPEGAVMPDTYVFHRGKTRAQVLADMQAAQTKLVGELWAAHRASLPLKSPEEAVTLASIVEKETAKADERPVIASVFLNRLTKHMRLQSDPTIIYGIAGGKGRLDRKLTHTDVVTPTPYNTYMIAGLPPGPIANPGRAALAAVMSPPDTTYLYFVADGSGGHAFASTLEEHNKNVAKWRDIAGNAAAAADLAPPAEAAAPPAESGTPAAPAATQPSATPRSSMPAIESTPGGDQTSAPVPNGSDHPAAIPLPETAQPPPVSSSAAPPQPPPAAAPEPARPTAAPPPAPVPAEPAIAPAPTPEAAAATPDAPVLVLKPGSVIKDGGHLIPVPRQRPKH